jgi:hypothetical protein
LAAVGARKILNHNIFYTNFNAQRYVTQFFHLPSFLQKHQTPRGTSKQTLSNMPQN